MQCELCGRETEKLFLVEIEGAKLLVCERCKSYGKVIKEIKNVEMEEERKEKPVVERKSDEDIVDDYDLVENYGYLIRKKREELGLTQEQFAKLLNIKLSMIHKIENQEIEPSYNLAKKIQKKLGIKILTETPNYTYTSKINNNLSLTLGDIIKIKEKKK